MASPEDRRWMQGEHNAAFSETLKTDEYADWGATALFYAALHFVDAMRMPQGAHIDHQPSTSHTNRDDARTALRMWLTIGGGRSQESPRTSPTPSRRR